MKKGLIFATTLAMALGVGVAVGAHQSKAVEAKADTNSVTLAGSFNSWSTTAEPLTLDGDYWTIEKTLAQNDEFKVIVNGSDWVGDGAGVHWCSGMGSVSGSGSNFKVLTAGTYIIKAAKTIGDYGDKSYGIYFEIPKKTPEFHLVGDFNEWTAAASNLLTVDSGDANHYSISGVAMEKDDELKIHDTANDEWFDNGSGNIVVSESGTYDVDFYVHVEYGDPIVLTKQVAPVEYTVKYGSSSFEFALDDEHKPEGADHQYKATLSEVYIFYAKKLEFFADGVKMTDIGVDYDMEKGEPVPDNNIVGDVTNGFKVHTPNTGMDVYMKQYGSWFSLWGAGYAENSFDLTYDASSLGTLSVNSEFVPYDDYVKEFKTSSKVSLSKLNAAQEQNNYYFSDTLGASVAVALETAGENNAVAKGTGSIYFDVHNDCNEYVYLKQKADLSLVLYVGGYVEEHSITIGGHTYPLTKSSEEGKEYEYLAHNVTLSAGDAVTAYTIEGETISGVTSKKVANNNLKENKTILADVQSADIVYDKNNNTLWISGLPAAGQHLLINGHTAVEMHHTDPFEGYDQFASGSMAFAANDTIKVINTGKDNSYADEWCPAIVVTSSKLAGKFVYDNENHQMKCVSPCTAAVYLKIKSGVDEVYFGDVPEYVDEAINYANGFKSAMSIACSAEGKQAAVEAAWKGQATAYAGLSDKAKEEIQNGSSSLVDEVIEFAGRYVGIYKQLGGKYDLDEFLDWGVTPSTLYVELEFAGTNNMAVIVISIAATSALAFTFLFVFKKKKQK